MGRGGMGIVYRGLDVNLHREVALKVLPPHLLQDADRKRRFVQEAQAAALDHPNVAGIHEIDEDDGFTFIVMELVEGESLAELLRRGPIPIERTVTIVRGLATEAPPPLDRQSRARPPAPKTLVLFCAKALLC